MLKPQHPLVLCFSGHDPSGGAGIQADIEAIAALGGHALSIITAHTVQDTNNVSRVSPVAPILIGAQVEALLADCEIGAIKIGLLGDPAQIPYLVAAIQRTKVPVVLDPVLRAGGGTSLTSAALQAAMTEQLLPVVDVLTPNAAEARLLAHNQNLDACGAALLGLGVKNALITGGDEPGDKVLNTWYAPDQSPRQFLWGRLPDRFHGAGCTLASALAALLARGVPLAQALEKAQAYTDEALRHAFRIGEGRKIPGRFPA